MAGSLLLLFLMTILSRAGRLIPLKLIFVEALVLWGLLN